MVKSTNKRIEAEPSHSSSSISIGYIGWSSYSLFTQAPTISQNSYQEEVIHASWWC